MQAVQLVHVLYAGGTADGMFGFAPHAALVETGGSLCKGGACICNLV